MRWFFSQVSGLLCWINQRHSRGSISSSMQIDFKLIFESLWWYVSYAPVRLHAGGIIQIVDVYMRRECPYPSLSCEFPVEIENAYS